MLQQTKQNKQILDVFSMLTTASIFPSSTHHKPHVVPIAAQFRTDGLHVIGDLDNDTAADMYIYDNYYKFLYDEVSLFMYTIKQKFIQDVTITEAAHCTFACVDNCLHFYWQGMLMLKLFPPKFEDNNLLIQYARVYDGDLSTEH